MIAEEHGEIGGAVLVEMADVEREGAHREQEDHDEHIGERRREIGRELALEDRPERVHVAGSRVRASASCVVIARNTSSRRPASA